jgi:hypothetical protein
MKRLVLLVALAIASVFSARVTHAVPIMDLHNQIERLDNDIATHQQFLREEHNNLSRTGINPEQRKNSIRRIQELSAVIVHKEGQRKQLMAQYEQEVQTASRSRGQSKGG